ncbi:MAG: extracellular solute-binding protein [Sedimentisphaerales bacterium]|nr:extracellular solute-binding protein [Sedimentisphaerales bacterium]
MSEHIESNHNPGTDVAQMPLHRKIAENLTNQVTAGELKPGQKLPSERRIAQRYSASRATVRTALQHLEQAGLITRRDRRSAVVTIRRDITPYLRIACGSQRVLSLFRRMADMQLLPPRCQLQMLDLQQDGVMSQIIGQPASSADVFICDLEHVNCLKNQSNVFCGVDQHLATDASMHESLVQFYGAEGRCQAVPLSVSPMVLYYNKAMFSEHQREHPHEGWNWDQLIDNAGHFPHVGTYGFQFRPTFSHLSSIMSRRGNELYLHDGKLAAQTAESFEWTVRFIHDMLYNRRISPVLAKADQINLFAQRRCAMAMDGFEMYNNYRSKLGDDLGVTRLPGDAIGGRISSGLALLAMQGLESLQPVDDMLRALLSGKTQQIVAQVGGGLPVRSDLLTPEALNSAMDIPHEVATLFIREAQNFHNANLPVSLDYKLAVDNLFLELWLGLDNVDSICHRFRELQ